MMLSIGNVFSPFKKKKKLTQVSSQNLEIILRYTVEFNSLESSATESNEIWKLHHSHKENVLATLRDVPGISLSLTSAT